MTITDMAAEGHELMTTAQPQRGEVNRPAFDGIDLVQYIV